VFDFNQRAVGERHQFVTGATDVRQRIPGDPLWAPTIHRALKYADEAGIINMMPSWCLTNCPTHVT
jgi:hypothetical protein